MSTIQSPEPLATITNSWRCRKRSGDFVPFDPGKIRKAVAACLRDVTHPQTSVPAVVEAVTAGVIAKLAASGDKQPGVEYVQRLVIQWLFVHDFFEAGEAYQNYREHHRKRRALETSTVFDRRVAFKPFDYPDVERFKNAIHDSFWTVREYDFQTDVNDFRVELTGPERQASTRAALAISQVEVKVKEFWARLGDRLGRAEFHQVGIAFADSEVRHADAYSKIIDELGLDDMFRTVVEVPSIGGRIDYLSRSLKAADGSDREFVKVLTAFTLLVEHVSLFSQFLVLKSFARHRQKLQRIDNVVDATQLEEQIHSLFGAYVIDLVRRDRPEWFGSSFYNDLYAAADRSLAAETAIVEWIFEAGELEYLPKADVIEFLKDRLNTGIVALGGETVYPIDPAALARTRWFYEGLKGGVDVDFFWKRSTNYAAHNTPITADTLF